MDGWDCLQKRWTVKINSKYINIYNYNSQLGRFGSVWFGFSSSVWFGRSTIPENWDRTKIGSVRSTLNRKNPTNTPTENRTDQLVFLDFLGPVGFVTPLTRANDSWLIPIGLFFGCMRGAILEVQGLYLVLHDGPFLNGFRNKFIL